MEAEAAIGRAFVSPYQVLDKVCCGLIAIGSTSRVLPSPLPLPPTPTPAAAGTAPVTHHPPSSLPRGGSTSAAHGSSESTASMPTTPTAASSSVSDTDSDHVSWLWGVGRHEVMEWLHTLALPQSSPAPSPASSVATPRPLRSPASSTASPHRQLFSSPLSRGSRSPLSPSDGAPMSPSLRPALLVTHAAAPHVDALSEGLAEAARSPFPPSSLQARVVAVGAVMKDLRAAWRRGDWKALAPLVDSTELAVGSAVRQLDVLLSSATVVGVADGHDRGSGTPIDNDSDRGDGGVGGARQDEAAVVVDGELSAGRPTVTLQEVSTVQTALQYASVELSWARTMLGLVAVSGKRRWVRPCVCVSNAVGPNISVASLPLSRNSYVLGCVDEQTRPVCPSQRLSTYWPRCCRPRLPMQ